MTTQEFNQLSDRDLLAVILTKWNEYRLEKKTRLFFQLMTKTLSVDWAGTGAAVRAKWGISYRKYIPYQACNIYKSNNLIALTDKERVVKFAEALHAEPVSEAGGYKVDKKIGSNITKVVSEWLEQNGTNTIAELITREAAKLRPVMVQINAATPTKVEGTLHKKFEEVLELAVQERQVFIAGPAGTGKTTLAAQIAKALQVRYSHISCTAGMSEAHLLGRMDAHGNYISTDFVDMYENGGVFLFDEVDAADSNTMLIINSALANGSMSVPNRKDARTASRNKEFYCLCAANTWGYGSSEYAGRNVLDAAFLDRFVASRVFVEYDQELETKIAGTHNDLLQAIWTIRKNVFQNKIRRVVSTRAIVSGVRSLESGKTLKYYITERFMVGWTPEEVAKAITNVVF